MTTSQNAQQAADYAADPARRAAPLDIPAEEFRAVAHALVDRIADFMGGLREQPVVPPGADAGVYRKMVERAAGAGLPEHGADAARLVDEAASLVLGHSTLIAHPRFFGYIVGSPSPIGALGDLLAASVNQNVGAWTLAPMATEIERQTVRWLAELVGLPEGAGGLLVSGGNMANIVCTVAARAARAGWDVRERGLGAGAPGLTMYASAETHTWVKKAADICGLGTDAIRWLPTDDGLRMRVDALRRSVEDDLAAGYRPFMVVATAGSVSTGAVDPVREIVDVCRAHDLWLHVDGAYGAPAAALPDASPDLRAIALADSIAIDPHKWLYVPVEAGCVLVRDPETLRSAFSYTPPYYHFADLDAEPRENFYEYGPQNSRAFRALKVWLTLRHAGREGIVRMIADDIALAGRMHEAASARAPELEVGARGLSIVTMRYVPGGLAGRADAQEYLDALNQALLERLQADGECFLSNAVLGGRFFLRSCIVNFRTERRDVEAVPEIVVRVGREVDERMRPGELGD